MVAEYILIMLVQANGPALTSVLFPSQRACETAKALVLDEFSARNGFGFKIGGGVRAACVPRSENG